nr:hypothetical protein [Bacteroides neonati]
MNRALLLFAFLLSAVQGFAQSAQEQQLPDSSVNKLMRYAYAAERFGKALPQEKVYLHFDNTAYYQGDDIWFQCYVVTSELNRPTALSKTLYVELLNPGGEIVAKRILPIRNGRCHSHLPLSQLPFYSGFYEVRAYTKYLLNFGEGNHFSRVLPVFDKPEKEGNYSEKNIRKYTYKYPQHREKSKKEKRVNLKFFPEGGNLIEGVASRIAFEATDAYGNPLELSGSVMTQDKKQLTSFAVTHEGRGVCTYTPTAEKAVAVVNLADKSYRFDLPVALKQGFGLQVDNLSSEDSLAITVQKNAQTKPAILALAVFCRGKLFNYCLLDLSTDEPLSFAISKQQLPAGIAQLVLTDESGQMVADRLVFVHQAKQLSVNIQFDKAHYQPYEPVGVSLKVRNEEGYPVRSPLSVAIRDGMEEVENRHSLLTDLLLTSEIKGYVRRPSYYFEADDSKHRTALDQLLMVQGWRRYAWKQWAGTEPFELKYLPEQGIEVHGRILSMVRGKAKPNVQISSFLMKRGADSIASNAPFLSSFNTDSLGRFAFVSPIEGKWNLILSVADKGKQKDCRIVLDRVFSPAPAKYPLAEMQVTVAASKETGEEQIFPTDTTVVEEVDFNQFMDDYEKSLARKGVHEKIQRLDEVVVKGKKHSREKDIYNNRAKSIAYYEVPSEIDEIKDKGGFIGNDIHELMLNMNKHFSRRISQGEEWLSYKSQMPLFVINYQPTMATEMDYNKYKLLNLEAIKAIYINEELSIKCQYADPRMSPLEVDDLYSCVVFIETYPDGEIPVRAGKGVRKTWLDGYSNEPKEFYQPDYSILPKENDYRRTLYWNPELIPDEDGNANIRFYNNGRAQSMRINAETIAEDGTIGSVCE